MGKKRKSRHSDSGSDDADSDASDGSSPSSSSSSEDEEKVSKRQKKEKHEKKEKKGKKEKKEKRASSSSSESSSEDEEERPSKKQKKDKKDKKDKKPKKEKTKKQKKEKGHKKHKDKDKGRKGGKDDDDPLVQAAKEFLKQQLAGGSAAAPAATLVPAAEAKQLPSSQQISDDDYFLKGNEFMAWLQEYKQILFNELTTEASRDLFSVFVKVWNSGRLATKYYAGLVQAPIKRTSHQWSFKGGAGGGAAKGMAAFLDDKKDKDSRDRAEERLLRKRQAGAQRELLEELVPRATGKDKVAEERFARREEAKARGASPDRAFLPGGGDMMGGDDSFAAAKAWEAKRAEGQRSRQLLKREDLTHKVAQAQAAEDEKMAQFRALLGQGPITIAKRQ